MTASTTPCCASWPERARRALGAALLCVWMAGALAAPVDVRNAALVPDEEGWLLSADVSVALSTRLEDVVERGVPLYFVLQVAIVEPRWYWFDATVAERTVTHRLAYHALTRQYRLSSGALHQNFTTLDEALRVMGSVRRLPVAERRALEPGRTYTVAMRFELDLSQLPKPLQVTALGERDWNLASDWLRWGITAPGAR